MLAYTKHLSCFFLCILLSVAGGRLHAQDPFAELARVQSLYTSADNYSLQLKIKAYQGHQSTELADVISGSYEVSGKRFKLVLGPAVTLKNETYLLGIDERFKEIDVADAGRQESAAGFLDFRKMEAQLRKHRALSLKTEADGNRTLTFDMTRSGDEYEKVVIRYRPSGELLSVVFFYRAEAQAYGISGQYKARVEVEYTSQNFHPTFPENNFSEKKYIRVTGREIAPQPAYKNYKIFDLL